MAPAPGCIYAIRGFVGNVPTGELSTYCAAEQAPTATEAPSIFDDGLAYTFVTDMYQRRDKSFVIR